VPTDIGSLDTTANGEVAAAGGHELSRRQLTAMVAIGFGGLFSTGGIRPDGLVLQANDATWPPGREGRGEQGQTERDDDRTPAPYKARNARPWPQLLSYPRPERPGNRASARCRPAALSGSLDRDGPADARPARDPDGRPNWPDD
jgi:hypothetical protein